MPEEETWDVIGSQVALQHPFLSVTMQNIRLPTGQVIQDWPIVDARSYAMVVAENNAGEILILEGYKHGLGRSSWQVIGGYLEPGEDPLAAAKRELLEEASLTSDFWQILGTFVVDANRYVSTAYHFMARHVKPVTGVQSDDLEQMSLRWVSKEDACKALYDGRIGIISSANALALALLLPEGQAP